MKNTTTSHTNRGSRARRLNSMTIATKGTYIPGIKLDMEPPRGAFDTSSVVIASVGVAATVATLIGVVLR